MNRFAFPLYLAFIVTVLAVGCTAPVHLRDRAHPSTTELSSEEKMQQTIGKWKDVHISKAIQKWGSPKEVNDDGTGWKTYIWQIPVHGFLPKQESLMLGSQRRQDRPIHSPRYVPRYADSKWNIHSHRLHLSTHILYASKRYNLENRHKKESGPRKRISVEIKVSCLIASVLRFIL